MKLKAFTFIEDAMRIDNYNSRGNLTCHPELDSGSINVDIEPSPEFLSSLQLTKKFNPLTEREGSSFNDTVFSRFTSHFSLRKTAFTLAEVLITLGIIGVVAAMTMPTLITNYRKKQTVVQLKKVYSELSQAAQLSASQNGDMIDWDYTLSAENFFNTYLSNFVKIGSQSISTAYNNDIVYKNPGGTVEQAFKPLYVNARIVTLSSGAQIFLSTMGDSSKATSKKTTILVDLNGFKKPNKLGNDLFVFTITPDGVQPYHWNDYEIYSIKRSDRNVLRNGPSNEAYQCNKSGRGMWCAALIMSDGWEIKSDYPW